MRATLMLPPAALSLPLCTYFSACALNSGVSCGAVAVEDCSAGAAVSRVASPAVTGAEPLEGSSENLSAGAISRVAFVDVSTRPSTVSSDMVISVSPSDPAGTVIVSVARADSGTAQEPPTIWRPSDRLADGGNPRMRRKTFRGKVSARTTGTGNALC